MKKKLLFVLHSLSGGGAERVVSNLMNNFDRQKYDIYLLIYQFKGPYIKDLKKDICVIDIGCAKVRKSIFRTIREINGVVPHVIFSTLPQINCVLLCIKPLLKGNPRLIIREANVPSRQLDTYSKIDAIVMKIIYRTLYSNATKIIAQAEKMKEDMVNNFKICDRKISRIYNPVDVQRINESKGENPFKDSTNINIVAIGRLNYQKGFDILIRAMSIVVDKIPNACLHILGEGELETELLALTEKMKLKKNIKFLGFTQNPYDYLKNCHIFVLSSRWEGFPNVVLEALACGARVVATDCLSGPSEILGDKYGVLVKPESQEQLAQGMLKMLCNKSEYNDCAKRAMDFDVKTIIKEYDTVIQNVLCETFRRD